MVIAPLAKALIFTACSGKSLPFCSRAVLGAMVLRAFWPQFEAHGTALTAHLPFFLSTCNNALEFSDGLSLLHGHLSSVRQFPYVFVSSATVLFTLPFLSCKRTSVAMISRSYLRAQSS